MSLKGQYMAIATTCFAGFGGFLYGYDTGYIITSIMSVGTFVGALLAYTVGDYGGRRFGIIAFLFLFCIGIACQTGASTFPTMVVGRVFAGLGVGGTSCLVPQYQCAPKSIRGAIVGGYQWAITIGLLIASVVVNGTKDFNDASAYRIPIWAFILGVGLLFLPESPRWLVMKGRNVEAKACISRIIAQPYYGTSYFKNSGIKNAFIINIATAVVNVGMTPVGLFAIERVGRRHLMMYGALGMAIAQFIVAIVGTVCDQSNMPAQRTLVGFVCIFVGHFAATWGLGAIFPLQTRGMSMSLSTASNWLLNFAIGYATPYLVDTGKGNADLQSKVFFIFFCLPETKGLSLEQVDLLYRNSTILGSNAYRKKILAENIHDGDGLGEKTSKNDSAEHHDETKTALPIV
ncbi:hypothetical protein RQP46_004958 [Phenoliferia psychrophenolica]